MHSPPTEPRRMNDKPLSHERKMEIRKKVRSQLAMLVEGDVNGDEFLMKEVWEDMENDEEMVIARGELRRILAYLNEPPNVFTLGV